MKNTFATENLAALLGRPQQRGWAVNLQEIQGPGTAVKFWGVVCLGKTCIVPKAVLDKVQGYPIPKEVQAFVGILQYW